MVGAASDIPPPDELLPLFTRMAEGDFREVLGESPGDTAYRFTLHSGDPAHPGPDALERAHREGIPLLNGVAQRIVREARARGRTVAGTYPSDLDAAREQHIGYVAHAIAHNPLYPRLNVETVRILVREHFAGTLRNNRTGNRAASRELLAEELAGLVNDDEEAAAEIIKFVMGSEMSAPLSTRVMARRFDRLANLASVWAGEATVEFAEVLVGPERGAALVKDLFGRSNTELLALLRDPQGASGVLLHFAATVHHLAWDWAGRAISSHDVAEGKRKGESVKRWNHDQRIPTRALLMSDPDAALKILSQIHSFLIHRGSLHPIARDDGPPGIPLFTALQEVDRHGWRADGTRVPNVFALIASAGLRDTLVEAESLSDTTAGMSVIQDRISQILASFAKGAVTDYLEAMRIDDTFRDALVRLRGNVDRLDAADRLGAQSESFKALYQRWAGQIGRDVLRKHLGEKATGHLARHASLDHLIALACRSLGIQVHESFTPANVVAMVEQQRDGMLRKDFFLGPDSDVDVLKYLTREVTNHHDEVNLAHLDLSNRIFNEIWIGLVALRRKKLGSGLADFDSDLFPEEALLNPPEIRDETLYAWGRHRGLLDEVHGRKRTEPEAALLAVSLIVYNLYKDLLQLKQASGVLE